MADVEVRFSGPLFEGDPRAHVRSFLAQACQAVADEGADLVVLECKRVFREPTPYFWLQVTTERVHNSQDVAVNDQDVIYGPWLEGTGSRNRTTRFKGYSMFRRTTHLLRRKAPAIVTAVLDGYLRRLR